MQGRAFKQVIRGHVIRPAEIRTTNTSGREFLSFSLAVDNLLDNKETGFINCSYWPHKDRPLQEDIVACSLLWISNDEQQGLVFADGSTYKRVEVTVEGQLSLRSVQDSKGYYVNLQYCTVDVHDRHVVEGVKQALGIDNQSQRQQQVQQQNVAPAPNLGNQQVVQQIEVPTTAPTTAPVQQQVQQVQQPVQPQPQPQQQAANVPQEGTIVQSADGTVYRIENGQYVPLGNVNVQNTAPAQQQQQQPATATPNTIGEMFGNAPQTNFNS